MDPNETYKHWWRALLEEDANAAREAYEDIREWLDRGGFEPKVFLDPIVRKQFFTFNPRTGMLSGLKQHKTCVRTPDGKIACGVKIGPSPGGEEDDVDPEAEPEEPEEGDLVTEDNQHFYQDGKMVLDVGPDASTQTVWRELNRHMDKEKFYPNVWWISDHGNWHRMKSPIERSREGLEKAQRGHRRHRR